MRYFAACLAAAVGLIVLALCHANHVDHINDQFRQHCQSLGGYAATDIPRDVCISREAVLDHE